MSDENNFDVNNNDISRNENEESNSAEFTDSNTGSTDNGTVNYNLVNSETNAQIPPINDIPPVNDVPPVQNFQQQDYSQQSSQNFQDYQNPYNQTPPMSDKEQQRRYKAEKKRLKKERKKGVNAGVVVAIGLACAILGGVVSAGASYMLLSNDNNIFGKLFMENLGGKVKPQIIQVPVVGEINKEYKSEVQAIAEKVSPSVVGIQVSSKVSSPFFGDSSSVDEGSGIIYRQDGYIITNFHVIQNAVNSSGTMKTNSKIEVVLPFDSSNKYEALIVGYDWMTDLAVVKIDMTNLPTIELGNSDELNVGELAVAVGNPGGLSFMGSVSVGVISGLNRTIALENTGNMTLIQTDAAINPGNSGGALVNAYGQLIGVNSVKIVSADFEGMGFAIPINQVKEICDDLIEHKYVKRPFIGIIRDTEYDAETAKANNTPEGVLVAEVSKPGPAYKAGIERGDIIIKLNGVRTETFEKLNEEKNKFKPGDEVTITVFRLGTGELEFKVILSETTGQ